jgi:hypothetical protein
MPSADEIPVVLVLFNRAECLGRVVEALRRTRPKRLFLVADGPRPGHPDEGEACRRARAVVEAVDWAADLRWRIAEVNIGCDRAVPEGLDWVFDQVAEAVVLEDDMVPAADFLPWCAAMLERYRGAPDISHISGRNELAVWPSGEADHLLARRGSLWGWASWASAWKDTRAACFAAAAAAPVELHPDPLVAQHLAFVHDLARRDHFVTWDLTWSLGAALAGKLTVLPPANLISNIGFRPDAMHTAFAGDFRGAVPTGEAPVGAPRPRPSPDILFDRWVLLAELLAAQRDAARLSRLAKGRHLVRDARLRLHLAPFDHPAEAVAVLRHLIAAGTHSPQLQAVLARLKSPKAAP